jgi:hypothetical protein
MARDDDLTSRTSSSDQDINSSFEDDEHEHEHDRGSEYDRNLNALEKQTTAASGLSLEQRAQSVVSRIRSREPGQTARFSHPLSHTKTTDDVIVDFEGPDDPYRPLNWGFRKKAITTVLYGLTTMGVYTFCLNLWRTVLIDWVCDRCDLGECHVRIATIYTRSGIGSQRLTRDIVIQPAPRKSVRSSESAKKSAR